MPAPPACPKTRDAQSGVLSRLLPACVFLLALYGLVAVMYSNGYGSLPPVEQRYSKAKNELDSLRSGDARAGRRDVWLRVAQQFQDIYDQDPKWANRPAALFRKAESLHGLARRSGGRSDYQSAAEAYETLAMRHAESRLADDALLSAAEIKAHFLGDSVGALRLLARIRTQYAQGDALPRARELERHIAAHQARKDAPQPKQAQTAQVQAAQAQPKQAQTKQNQPRQVRSAPQLKTGKLTKIAWKTLNAGQVQITVELDRSVRWQVRRAQAKNAAAPASLVLDLEGALPDARIRDGARVADSPLSAVRVGAASGEQTRLFFDFATLARYETRVEQDPFKIILDVRARDAKTQQRADRTSETTRDKKAQAAGAASSPEALVLPAVAPLDLALQLGLTVQSVFLDVGHGGKDPGTGHNGLVEKEVALDIARRVGKLLRNRGIEVQFSRENDRYLSLTDRTRMAGKAGADLFVSLHVNASADPQVSGFETYYLDLASSKEAARLATLENAGSDKKMGELTAILADFMLSARTQESRQLARTLQRSVMSRLSKQRFVARDGGVKSAPLHVLIGTGMPAVLVELGYCSNKEEARRLGSAAYRQSLAEGIAEGILAYRDMLLRKQTVDVTRDTRRS